MRRLSRWLAPLLLCGLAAPLAAWGDEGEVPAAEGAVTTGDAAAPEAEPAPEESAAPEEAVAPAEADEPEAEEPEEEEAEPSALGEYGASVGNRFLMGFGSLITAPADPVMSAVKPDKEFEELPLAIVTKWPVGFVQGTLLMAHRASSGLLDMTFSPLTPMKMLSPEPRFSIFPGVEHEEY